MRVLTYEEAIKRAKSHTRVSQYTTFGALKCIIENKSLRLSRVDKLNDTVENSGIIDLWKQKVFVSCFTYREDESYFFWKVYSRDNEGVMFSFDRCHLESGMIYPDEKCEQDPLGDCKKTDVSVPFSPQIDSTSWGVFDQSVLDVSYVGRNGNFNCQNDHTQGRIKHVEWDMEYETRLRVAVRPKGLENRLKETQFEYSAPENKYLYFKLSEPCLNSMQIVLSPFSSDELYDKVMQLLKSNALHQTIKVKRSVLTGETIQENK